jgi:hypothetical protein
VTSPPSFRTLRVDRSTSTSTTRTTPPTEAVAVTNIWWRMVVAAISARIRFIYGTGRCSMGAVRAGNSAAGHGPHDVERLAPLGDLIRQGLVGPVLR